MTISPSARPAPSAGLARGYKPVRIVASRPNRAARSWKAVVRASGQRSSPANAVADAPSSRGDLRGRMLAASVFALCRDVCATVGLATMLAGYAQSCGVFDDSLYDRVVLGATDASLVWAVWRGATLNARVLQCGAGGLTGQSRGADAEAAAALAALAWGASGPWLAAAVDAQVQALSISLLRKDATIMRLRRALDEGGRAD
ncbi:hypothetical protein Rsub_03049 [Raphidocelis subcapitata]|uniref:Uncharacterized protein n=1 Tax=Raphidocelis subcapitata TaxID=307507 RepID=A0A2V0NSU5_9CHLO|nr:hypothetical protein Rsub_03049 [Raphidocelis subcapitata]|eukprot:GBF90748.1 hypothetical protein Rsub_03049 [Raphidocelis subcapitata]